MHMHGGTECPGELVLSRGERWQRCNFVAPKEIVQFAGASAQLGKIDKTEVEKTIEEAQNKLKRHPDRASSPSLMNGHATGSFHAAGVSGGPSMLRGGSERI